MKAKDIMTTAVKVARPENTVEEVAKILLENHISGLPVVDSDNKLVGIISEGDLIFRDKKVTPPAFSEILGGVIYFGSPERFFNEVRRTVAYTVEELMTRDIITVSPDTNVEEIATIMIERQINRVPVVEGEKMVGIVTRQDLIKGKVKS